MDTPPNRPPTHPSSSIPPNAAHGRHPLLPPPPPIAHPTLPPPYHPTPHTHTAGILFCETLLIFAYYGLLAIGLQIENPFAFHYGT